MEEINFKELMANYTKPYKECVFCEAYGICDEYMEEDCKEAGEPCV